MFEQNYDFQDVLEILECDVNELLDNFQFFLHILKQARRSRREEIHVTSLIRVFFETFDDRINDY